MGPTVAEIKSKLQAADAAEFAVLERSLVADTRKGVRAAVESARRRLAAEAQESARLEGMYSFQSDIAHGGIVVGLDEVGRGPLAGPLAVGAVVLPEQPHIPGLNDSKQVKPESREAIARRIKEIAVAWTVQYVSPEDIDANGMTASLLKAFRGALAVVESAGVKPDTVLLDGNPLHMDPREVNVVKGDGKCASIAAASILAKVSRDRFMEEMARQYPQYRFDKHKGYGTKLHYELLDTYGPSPIHRRSFLAKWEARRHG